jgi:hypothetical protein
MTRWRSVTETFFFDPGHKADRLAGCPVDCEEVLGLDRVRVAVGELGFKKLPCPRPAIVLDLRDRPNDASLDSGGPAERHGAIEAVPDAPGGISCGRTSELL